MDQAATFILEGEGNDKQLPFRAWRRGVASYALKISVAIPPIPELDNLLEQMGNLEDPNSAAREEVETVVDALTKALKLGGTAPKSTTK